MLIFQLTVVDCVSLFALLHWCRSSHFSNKCCDKTDIENAPCIHPKTKEVTPGDCRDTEDEKGERNCPVDFLHYYCPGDHSFKCCPEGGGPGIGIALLLGGALTFGGGKTPPPPPVPPIPWPIRIARKSLPGLLAAAGVLDARILNLQYARDASGGKHAHAHGHV